MTTDEQPPIRRWPIWPWLVLAVAGVVVTAVAAIFGTVSGADPAGPRPVAAGQTTLTVVRVETSTVTATVTVAAPPVGPAVQLVNGLHQVGVNVVPGTFRTPGPDGSNGGGCYWSRSTTSGEFVDNGVLSGPGTITIALDELVEIAGCRPWALTF